MSISSVIKKNEQKVTSYPRLGVRESTGDIYVQYEPNYLWSCVTKESFLRESTSCKGTYVTPFEVGQEVVLKQR